MPKPRRASAADREVIAGCAAAGIDPPPTVHALDRLRGAGCLPERYLPDGVGRSLGRGNGTRAGTNPPGYIDQAAAALRLIDRRKDRGERVPLRFAPAVLFQRGYPIAEHHLKTSYRAIQDFLVEEPLEKASRDRDTAGLDDEDARLDQVDAVAQRAYTRPDGLRRTLRDEMRKSGGSKADFRGLISTLFALASAGHPPGEAEESAMLLAALGVVIDADQAAVVTYIVADVASPAKFAERLDSMTLAELEQGREDLGLLAESISAASHVGSDPDMVSAINGWSADHPVEVAALVPMMAVAKHPDRNHDPMTAEPLGVVETIFARDTSDARVLVLDGYGLSVTVSRGHLVLRDGLGRHRRERRLPRAQRIVILGHTGNLSLEAIRWCADTGIALLHVDTDGRVLMVADTAARTDARILRAQAAAPHGPAGIAIARHLLHSKLTAQADNADQLLDRPGTADVIRARAADLAAAALPRCRELEAQAANAYFGAWTGHVACRFATNDQPRVPEGWQSFTVRNSPLRRSHGPRNAADPVNALLNYGYALAEAEARIAALAVRLEPTLGILHTDQKARDSFALDLLEPARPVVERYVLRLLAGRTFRAGDFTETRDGRCRLLPPLTHHLTEQLQPVLARALAGPAECVAHALAGTSPSVIELRTPLSRANTTGAQTRGRRSSHRRPAPTGKIGRTCERCGADLYGSARKLCPTCWPVMRNSYLAQANATRTKHEKPAKPTEAERSGGWTLEQYRTVILPGLADISLRDIERATGLSNPTCSRLKRGLQIPNPKHWSPLAALGDIETK